MLESESKEREKEKKRKREIRAIICIINVLSSSFERYCIERNELCWK